MAQSAAAVVAVVRQRGQQRYGGMGSSGVAAWAAAAWRRGQQRCGGGGSGMGSSGDSNNSFLFFSVPFECYKRIYNGTVVNESVTVANKSVTVVNKSATVR